MNLNFAKNNNTLEELIEDQNTYQIWWIKFYYPISINSIIGRPVGVIQGNDFLKDDNGNLILSKLSEGYWGGEVRPNTDSDATKELGLRSRILQVVFRRV